MLSDEQIMLAVIKAATGDSCNKVFKYEKQPDGWQLLLCDDTKNMYRLNESLTPEVLERRGGQYGELMTWHFINGKWELQ